ncbi:glutathione S-transferase family protein, partial [Acinetobacter baumannii]|uniref:glutathione S-transferase family protein n=1 Tax=Acinetobacter baumannii TaxID=470 RepID=UPI003AF68774
HDAYQALVQGPSESNPYVGGEQFTAADVSVGAMLLWKLKMKTIESHPAITRYVVTIKQREGLKQSSMGQLV